MPPTLDVFRDAIDADHVYSERDLAPSGSWRSSTSTPIRSATFHRWRCHAGNCRPGTRFCGPPSALADVAPLEALRVPAEFDGSAGLNRATVPAHQAELNADL
ncbi:hypothetical protein ACS0Y7_37030 [Burkholderia gladioli]|uniref:hypothetical protein n=1 Tax=Burkholderia gladioli TaxID=28095 RepID=UPI003F78EA69